MGIPKIRLFLWGKVLIKAVSLISVGIVQDANHNIAFNRLKLLMDYTKAPAKSRTLRHQQKSGFYHHGQIYSIHTQYQYMYIASDVSDWFYTVWFSLSFTQMKQLVISSEHKAILECRRLEVEAYKMERHISLHVSKIPLQLSKSWPTYHTFPPYILITGIWNGRYLADISRTIALKLRSRTHRKRPLKNEIKWKVRTNRYNNL